jgi:hypothetical protein
MHQAAGANMRHGRAFVHWMEATVSAVIPRLSILWFGPGGAFFRPGRLIQKLARAAAVKDGRHSDLSTCSPLPGHP